MQTMLYASEWSNTSCAGRAFEMFWFGPLFGFAIWVVCLIPLRTAMVPYLWLVPVSFAAVFGPVCALARTTTNVYLEGNEIVQNACRAGKAEQERAPVSTTRSTFRIVGKSKAPVLSIYWPNQPFALQIPLESGRYLANVQTFAPDQVGEYVKTLKAQGDSLPWGLSDPTMQRN